MHENWRGLHPYRRFIKENQATEKGDWKAICPLIGESENFCGRQQHNQLMDWPAVGRGIGNQRRASISGVSLSKDEICSHCFFPHFQVTQVGKWREHNTRSLAHCWAAIVGNFVIGSVLPLSTLHRRVNPLIPWAYSINLRLMILYLCG